MRNFEEKYFTTIEKLMISGLTTKAFSDQQLINNNTLIYWKKRYNDQNMVQ